jgi:Skp family chaperone for outer membrane proteins
MKTATLGRLAKSFGQTFGNRIVGTLLSLIAAVTAQADEPVVARFDAKRVFEQYQHTKDIELANSAKRHPMGPGSYTPSMERHDVIKRRFSVATEKLKQANPGSPEHQRGELELRIVSLELELDELRASLENANRAQASAEEHLRHRAMIINEIWAEAGLLGRERGYSVVLPEGLPTDGILLNVIINNIKADDITQTLLTRLNQRYSTKALK